MIVRFLIGPVGAARDEASRDFARLLEERLQASVVVRSFATYGALMRAARAGDGDFAWLPPALLVQGEDDGVTALVGGVRAREAQYRGGLFARADRGLMDLSQCRGLRVAWVDRESCAGYLFVRQALIERGFHPSRDFAEEKFIGGHRDVAWAVARGEADVGATFVHGDSGGWALIDDPPEVQLLLTTEPIPSDAICATASTDAKLRDRFTEAMQGLHDEAKGRSILKRFFGVDRFEVVLPSRYGAVRNVLTSRPPPPR